MQGAITGMWQAAGVTGAAAGELLSSAKAPPGCRQALATTSIGSSATSARARALQGRFQRITVQIRREKAKTTRIMRSGRSDHSGTRDQAVGWHGSW